MIARFALALGLVAALVAFAPAPTPAFGQTARAEVASIAETRWHGFDTLDGEALELTAYFRADGVLVYTYVRDGRTFDNARWRQRDALITFDTNQYFAVYSGVIDGNRMGGAAYSKNGTVAIWSLERD